MVSRSVLLVSLLNLFFYRCQTANLPVVDLGYARYSAANYSSTDQAYTFSNLRYAAPPIGQLRFAAPHAPAINRTLQDGSHGSTCFQAAPNWVLNRYGRTSNSSSSASGLNLGGEDCLFLDVVVPKKIYDSKNATKKYPVLVFIPGGGYVGGSKDSYTVIAGGLINESEDGLIFVSMNYRLGAFGFLAGPTFGASGGLPNAAFYDQRFALEWIQKYIHLFGGDKKQVTVMGESAGAGSIMHQITAYGGLKGNGTTPFQRAISQSAAWPPIISEYEKEASYVKFLQQAGCLQRNLTVVEASYGLDDSGLACLRKANSFILGLANFAVVNASSYGTFTYGPVVDGSFVPALPGILLDRGQFDHNVTMLIGHNADEAATFVPPTLNTTTQFTAYITGAFSTVRKDVLNFIEDVLYPPPSNRTTYKNNFERAVLTASEAIFTCNTVYLANALGNKTYNYIFSVPPAYHGYDIAYTFYVPSSGTNSGSTGVNATVAKALQSYIVDFAIKGTPNSAGVPFFPMYGNESHVISLNTSGIPIIRDPTANARCQWWQKAIYY